jgi:hypothetical protein
MWTNLSASYTVPAGVAYVAFYAQIYDSTEASEARFDDATLTITAPQAGRSASKPA